MPRSHITPSDDLGRSSNPPHGDLLSELLSPLRLRGERVSAVELISPSSTAVDEGPARFHFVTSGEIGIRLDDVVHHAGAGDLMMLPQGKAHSLVLASGLPPAEMVSGTFRFDSPLRDPILSALPSIIRIARDHGGNAQWLEPLVHFLLAESSEPGPGASIMISRLIDVLVVRTLRSWSASRPGGPAGWIGGLADARVERALSAIHSDPFRSWTVGSLADVSAMSRSAFAARFAACTGDPPLRYLKNWRLALARDLLASSARRVGEVARQVGYDSEASFSRAYKARFGSPPSGTRALN